jgi:hypothetical protein
MLKHRCAALLTFHDAETPLSNTDLTFPDAETPLCSTVDFSVAETPATFHFPPVAETPITSNLSSVPFTPSFFSPPSLPKQLRPALVSPFFLLLKHRLAATFPVETPLFSIFPSPRHFSHLHHCRNNSVQQLVSFFPLSLLLTSIIAETTPSSNFSPLLLLKHHLPATLHHSFRC